MSSSFNPVNSSNEFTSIKQDEVIRIICDITEFPLNNGKKGYLHVALNLSDRSITGYQVWTHQKKELALKVHNLQEKL